MPRASKEVVDAVVTRKLYEKTLHDAVPEDKELTLKPDISKTLRTYKVKERYHNGKYEENKFSRKGKKAWSCCQCKDEDDEGCVVKVVDKQKWILSSYTS